jgi:tyrosyl-tRNA synthetase
VASTITQRRWIGVKVQNRRKEAKEQWAQWATEIEAGKRRNLWDIFEERGFVKDVAGYG